MDPIEAPRVLDSIPFDLERDSFFADIRLDAYPELADELERYLELAASVARPRAMFRVAYLDQRDGERLEIGGRWFESAVLAENLEDVNRVFAYASTCGRELYELDLSDFDPFASFWHDTFKTRALEAATTRLCEFIKQEYEIEGLSSMNPGSGDVDVWPVQQQRPLFDLLGETEEQVGVRLTESCLMVPDKSVSGVFFPSERAYVNCQSCTRKICPNRRAPYRARR